MNIYSSSLCFITSNVWVTILFAFLIILLLSVLWFLYNWRKRATNENASIRTFSSKIQNTLNKLDTPQEKIDALSYALERVESNDEYRKNLAWRSGLLITVYLYMVMEYDKMQDHQNIIKTCDSIIELNTKHALTYYNRGYTYLRMQKYNEAATDLDTYLNLDKKDKCGLRSEAEKLFAEAAKHIPSSN